jgi:hypothetical protein
VIGPRGKHHHHRLVGGRRAGEREGGVATREDVEAPDDLPVDLDHFQGLRRNRVVNDPVVLFELFRRGTYGVPMSDGACARLRLHDDENGQLLVTAAGYTAMVVVWASTHRRGQPAEFTINDPQYRVFDAFPAGDRGVLMFLVGDRLGSRYRLTRDGTSLAVTAPNSVAGQRRRADAPEPSDVPRRGRGVSRRGHRAVTVHPPRARRDPRSRAPWARPRRPRDRARTPRSTSPPEPHRERRAPPRAPDEPRGSLA